MHVRCCGIDTDGLCAICIVRVWWDCEIYQGWVLEHVPWETRAGHPRQPLSSFSRLRRRKTKTVCLCKYFSPPAQLCYCMAPFLSPSHPPVSFRPVIFKLIQLRSMWNLLEEAFLRLLAAVVCFLSFFVAYNLSETSSKIPCVFLVPYTLLSSAVLLYLYI